MTYRPWVTVGLLWVVALLNYLDRLMITTMREPIVASIPMTDAQFGLLTAVFLWVYGAVSPLGGYLADVLGRRAVIVASLLVWSAVTWWTAHVQSFHSLLLARGLMGVSEACYIPAALAMIADFHKGPTRSLATGIHMSGVYAGAALGGLGGYIAERHGWRAGFSLFGAIGIGYALIMAMSLRDAKVEDTTEEVADGAPTMGAALRSLFGVGAFWMLLGLNALVGVANWGINGWLPTYLKDQFKLGLGEAGMSATAYIQVASFIGVVAGGAWADRWSASNPRARALVPAIGFLATGPCLYFASATAVFAAAIAGLVVYGLGRGFFDANLMPVLRQATGERYSATGYGVLNFVSCATGGLMIYAGGWLKDAHIDLGRVFQVAAVGLFVSGLMLLAVRLRPRAGTVRA